MDPDHAFHLIMCNKQAEGEVKKGPEKTKEKSPIHDFNAVTTFFANNLQVNEHATSFEVVLLIPSELVDAMKVHGQSVLDDINYKRRARDTKGWHMVSSDDHVVVVELREIRYALTVYRMPTAPYIKNQYDVNGYQILWYYTKGDAITYVFRTETERRWFKDDVKRRRVRCGGICNREEPLKNYLMDDYTESYVLQSIDF